MALTLGFTSMDKATEAALRAAFDEANGAVGERFALADDSAAEFVVIDMDSMYGPMGWLRLHAAGKKVVGLTSAARTQADFRLGRPFDTAAVIELLRQLARSAGESAEAAQQTSTTPAAPAAAPQPPAQQEPLPALQQQAAATSGPGSAPQPDQEPELPPEPEPEAPPRDPVFADWMQPGALTGRLRYRRDNGPELWLDADARHYHGPAQLKPLAPYFEGAVEAGDFQPVDDATWSAGAAAAGEPRPMLRLQWLGALVAGNGALLPGYDPDGRYRLTKWPQTEREYPHHFRIATAMMRGPATLAEIAEASRAPLADVADFTNANLATGFAEFVPEPEPEPEPAARPAGFFSRLRGRP